jgi:hypothetical protein
MRLVFKSFGEESWTKENKLNFEYTAAHSCILTSEEPSDLKLEVHLNYKPAGYDDVGQAAKVEINRRYSPLYLNWERDQAEPPDLSLLFGQYMAFWTARNTEAQILIDENERKRIAAEAAAIVVNTGYIQEYLPGCVPWEEGKKAEGWSYLNVKHNEFIIVHKNGMTFSFHFNDPKWSVTMRSDHIGTAYDMKKSKNIKNVFKHVLESDDVKNHIERHDRQLEQRRKEKVLRKTMEDAGWQRSGGEYVKSKESGKYYANASIADDSDRVTIYKVRRYIDNLMMEPHKMDISIFE